MCAADQFCDASQAVGSECVGACLSSDGAALNREACTCGEALCEAFHFCNASAVGEDSAQSCYSVTVRRDRYSNSNILVVRFCLFCFGLPMYFRAFQLVRGVYKGV